MAITATRSDIAIVDSLGMDTGRIGLDGTNRPHARRCRLSRAMAHTTGLSLAGGVYRRCTIGRRRHVVDFAVTGIARRQVQASQALHTEFAVDADGLYLDHVVVTGSAVDGIKPTPVPAAIGADMAVEAFGHAMNGDLELCEVNFVTIVTGIRLFFVARQ